MANKEMQPYVISILTKTGPFHLSVLEGLKSSLKGIKRFCHCRTYKIGSGDSWQEAEESMEHIIESKTDLVISIGALCSQIARSAIKKNNLDTPLLFGGVTMPEVLDLKPTSDNPHQTSGVSLGFAAYLTAAEILQLLKPNLKKVLLPYSPLAEAGTLSNAAMLLKQYFARHGVDVVAAPIKDLSTGMKTIEENLDAADTIMTLEGCLINAYDEKIIELCDEKAITFFAGGDISSVEKGAAVGFVPNPKLIGKPLYEYVSAVVDGGKQPLDLPIKFLKNSGRQVVLNPKAAEKQGLFVPQDLQYFFRFGSVIGASAPLESTFFD